MKGLKNLYVPSGWVTSSYVTQLSQLSLFAVYGATAKPQVTAALERHMAPHERQPNLRLVDNYIAAFHVKDTELLHWAMTHPEYSHPQVGFLVCWAGPKKQKLSTCGLMSELR